MKIGRYILALLLLAGIVQADSFGHTADSSGGTVDKAVDTILAVTGGTFIAESGGTGDSLSAYIIVYGTDTRVKMALYKRSGALLDSTEERLLPSSVTTTKRFFSFVNSPTIEADSQYFIAVWAHDSTGLLYASAKYTVATGDTCFLRPEVYGDWPGTAPTTSFLNNFAFRMACYYTVGGEPPEQNIMRRRRIMSFGNIE